MGLCILHNNGSYNIFTTICDSLYWEEAITLEELTAFWKEEYGNNGTFNLTQGLERAHKNGSSGYMHPTIEDCYKACKHGVDKKTIKKLSYEEFILKYLTLPAKDT